MGKAFRYRVFGTGKMPPALREAAAHPGVLIAAEGVPIREMVDRLKMPRASVRHGVRLLVGALVLAPDRLLLSVGKFPIVNTDLREPARGGAALTLGEDGLRIDLDVARVMEGASGSVAVHYRVALVPAILAQLPASGVRVSIANAGPSLLNGWKRRWAR
jgi:hypothetical protein